MRPIESVNGLAHRSARPTLRFPAHEHPWAAGKSPGRRLGLSKVAQGFAPWALTNLTPYNARWAAWTWWRASLPAWVCVSTEIPAVGFILESKHSNGQRRPPPLGRRRLHIATSAIEIVDFDQRGSGASFATGHRHRVAAGRKRDVDNCVATFRIQCKSADARAAIPRQKQSPASDHGEPRRACAIGPIPAPRATMQATRKGSRRRRAGPDARGGWSLCLILTHAYSRLETDRAIEREGFRVVFH